SRHGTSGAESRGAAVGGGDLVRWVLSARRWPADKVRRVFTGARRSLRSEFCLLKVPGRGRPTPTLRESRWVRLLPCSFRGSAAGELARLSSRFNHRPNTHRCHMLGLGGGGFSRSGRKLRWRGGLPKLSATE